MKLLIVEDNPVNLKLMQILTKHLKFESVLFAKNGQEALDICEKAQPELVLCDVQMPVMDGIQFLQHIRQHPTLNNTIIIAVTAHAMLGEKERLLGLGFDSYMSKPLDTRQLRSELLKFQEQLTSKSGA